MGFLEKLKNTFFEEEYVEVEEVEKPKKEPKPIAKKIENKRKREEDKKEIVEDKKEEEVVHENKVEKEEPVATLTTSEETSVYNYADKELLKTDTSIQYFEDDDFVDKTEEIRSVPDVKKKLYGGDPEEIYEKISYTETVSKPYSNPEAKNGFKPTPIISPIYGILDKNYKKEEVVDKKDKPSSYVSRKNIDLDFVRNKAFGSSNLEKESESSLVSTDDDGVEEEMSPEENLLYDMTKSDEAPAVEKVTIADAEEYFEDLGLEYNVDYKDSRYEKATGRRSRITKEEVSDTVPKKKRHEEDQSKLEDNLFDLIDSMYEEEKE